MVKLNQVYGLESPIQSTYPLPIIANRNPDNGDKNFIRGQMWVNQITGEIFILSDVVAGAANWSQISSGSLPVVLSSGNVTLTAGEATVADATLTATDLVFLSRTAVNASSALGSLAATVTAGVSFDIDAEDPANPGTAIAGDVSTVNYMVVTGA